MIKKKDITGSFDQANDLDREAVMEIVANFHYRDMKRSDDGSLGSIKITHKELNDCLAYALMGVVHKL